MIVIVNLDLDDPANWTTWDEMSGYEELRKHEIQKRKTLVFRTGLYLKIKVFRTIKEANLQRRNLSSVWARLNVERRVSSASWSEK